jgi:2,3-bisphosphoglycerate-dependent phosphoglycerate mutase
MRSLVSSSLSWHDMASVVLLRHGESEWNRCDKYAGWIDVDLTQRGIDQAKEAGSRMSVQGMDFDICYTSVLKRATHTAWHCLDSMDRTWIPITRSWRLNERHYGALHGLSRAESVATYGEEQVRLWRRGFADRPPRQIGSDQFKSDPRYIDVQVPDAESLQDTVFRVAPLLAGASSWCAHIGCCTREFSSCDLESAMQSK